MDDWLASTYVLQRQSYGVDPSKLEGDALADYILWNAYALTDELHEATREVRWKPWAVGRGEIDRERFARELVDLGHFLGNLAVAIGMTDEEWELRYREKQQKNRERMLTGVYDGVGRDDV